MPIIIFFIFRFGYLKINTEISVKIGNMTNIIYLEIKTGLNRYPKISGMIYEKKIKIKKKVKKFKLLKYLKFCKIKNINENKYINPINREPKKLEKKKFVKNFKSGLLIQ